MPSRITEGQKNIAIEQYTVCGTMAKAAKAASCNRDTLYEEMKRDKAFKQAMTNAKQVYVDSLEDVLDKRIRDDKDKASAILLMFKLKKERPEYRDRMEHKVEGEINIISGVPRPKDKKKE